MLSTVKPNVSAASPAPGVTPPTPRRPASSPDCRYKRKHRDMSAVKIRMNSPWFYDSAKQCNEDLKIVVLKGKPPTKKAKVLQKPPLITKLAAYAQHQANQQSGVKKSGESGF